jgi:hypothetical protein
VAQFDLLQQNTYPSHGRGTKKQYGIRKCGEEAFSSRNHRPNEFRNQPHRTGGENQHPSPEQTFSSPSIRFKKKIHSIPFDLLHELIDFVHGAAVLILAVRVSNLPAIAPRLTFSFYSRPHRVDLTRILLHRSSCISDPAAGVRRPPQQRKPPLLMLVPLIYAPVLPLSTCFALESPPSCFRCSSVC